MSRFIGYILDGPHKGQYCTGQSPYLRLPVLEKPPTHYVLSDALPESKSIEIVDYEHIGKGWRRVKPKSEEQPK